MRNKTITILILLVLLTFSILFISCKDKEKEIIIEPVEGMADSGAEEEPVSEEVREEVQDEGEDAVEITQRAQVMDISPAEIFEIIQNNEDYLMVDVRTQEEYDSGHLEGVLPLPVQELDSLK